MKPLICIRCPKCGGHEFRRVRPVALIAFRYDRSCLSCETRYAVPTPVWASWIFVVLGALLACGCVVSLALSVLQGAPAGVPMNMAFAVLGVLCLRQGVHSLREDVATHPQTQQLAAALPGTTLAAWTWRNTALLAFVAVTLLICAAAIIGVQSQIAAARVRLEQQKVAVRALKDLGGDVHVTDGDLVLGISLQRATATTRMFEGQQIGDREIVDDDLAIVARFPSLRELTVRSLEVTDAGLRRLPSLSQLTSFGVFCPRVTQFGVEQIAEMDGLESLHLPGTQVADLSPLRFDRKPKLWYLDMSQTPLAGTTFSELSHLKSLRSLDLSQTGFDDTALSHLSGLKELETLRLDGTRVSDEGLTALRGLTNLKFLYVDDTNVSIRGRLALQKYLPQCQVIVDWGIGPGVRIVIPAE